MALDVLLDRIAHEWETRNKIFDLPTARICLLYTSDAADE